MEASDDEETIEDKRQATAAERMVASPARSSPHAKGNGWRVHLDKGLSLLSVTAHRSGCRRSEMSGSIIHRHRHTRIADLPVSREGKGRRKEGDDKQESFLARSNTQTNPQPTYIHFPRQCASVCYHTIPANATPTSPNQSSTFNPFRRRHFRRLPATP